MSQQLFTITGMDLSGYMVKDAAVDDLDAAVAAVKARDIPVLMEHETPVCFMAMINDTEGNSIVLHKRKTA